MAPIKLRVLANGSFFELLNCAIIYYLTSYIMDMDMDLDDPRTYMTPIGQILIFFVLMAILDIAVIAHLMMGNLEQESPKDFLDKILSITYVPFFVAFYICLNELPSPETSRLPPDFYTKGKVWIFRGKN